MERKTSLLEGIGVNSIDAKILFVREQLNILMGTESTKYPISIENYAQNARFKEILDEIVNSTAWDTSVTRYSHKEGDARRYVYIVASVIRKFAIALRDTAIRRGRLDSSYKDAINAFNKLCEVHFAVGGNNQFAKAGAEFNYAMKEAIDVYTPTRVDSSISEDYAASANVNVLYGYVASQVNGAIQIVNSMLDAAGVSGVDDNSIDNAAKLMLAYANVQKRIFGPEDRIKNPNIYERDNPPKYLYNIIYYGWSKKTDMLDDEIWEEFDNEESHQLKTTASKLEYVKTHTNVVKDMAHLGDNTKQLNYLSNKTQFTSAMYYKIFAIDPLSGYSYKSVTNKIIFKIMNQITTLVNAGFGARDINESNAADFASYINDLFFRLARKTDTALLFRENMLTVLDKISVACEKDFDKLYKSFGLGSKQKESKRYVRDAIRSIRNDILYVGDSTVSNKTTGTGKSIDATRLTSPVYSFGDMNTTERNTTMDLTAAGVEVSKMMSFYDDELHVVYHGGLVDTDISSDVIPKDDIKTIYSQYVSSALLPANVSKSKAWIMLSGIIAYSRIDHGTLEDTTGISPSNQKANDLIVASNITKDTRADKQAVIDRRMSNPDMLDLLERYRFMDKGTARNAEFRNELISRVSAYPNFDPDIGKKVTKVRAVCDKYMSAISDYAERSGVSKTYVISELYNVSPKLLELVNGKDAAVDKIIARYLSDVNGNSQLVTAIANVTTMLTVLTSSLSMESKNAAVGVLKSSIDYLDQLNLLETAVRRANKVGSVYKDGTGNTDLTNAFEAIKPQQFTEIAEFLRNIDDNVNETKDKKEKIQLIKDNASDIKSAAERLSDAGNKGIEALDQQAKQVVTSMINSSDNKDSLVTLYNDLMGVVDEINKNNVTFQTVYDVQKVIASTMYGLEQDNLNALQTRNINQLVGPVKVLKTLMNVSGVTKADTDEIKTTSVDANYDIPDGGNAGLDELHPMNSSNKGRMEYNRILRDIDEDIYSASTYEDIPFEGKIVETALNLVGHFTKLMSENEGLSDELDIFADMVSDELGVTLDEQDNISDALSKVADNDSVDPSLRSYAERCLSRYNLLKPEMAYVQKSIDIFKQKYPSTGGLIDALLNGKVTADEVKYALHELDVANELIGNLTKYNSIDIDEEDRRVYAYTKSDEDTIAQIIHVLGRYVTEPYDGTADEIATELADAFESISTIVTRYSGNPLSIKMVNKVLADIKDTIGKDNGESTVVAVIKDINSLGRILLSRISQEADTELLKNVNKINTPADHSEKYGKAMDAFAKSIMRLRDKNVKSAGKADTLEQEAREQFAKYIISDVTENVELSKYAYMLGKAFNSYDRLMRDERVSDERSFNSIFDSFKGVKLWGNLGKNDLQRELVSAIIDDERNGDKSYPTVQAVVDAAKTGSLFQTYGSMYSKAIGDKSKILNDTKNIQVAFDANGNVVHDPNKAVALDMEQISRLAVVGSNDVYDNVTDLVHAIRMDVCRTLTKTYGTLDEVGNVELAKKTTKQADALLSEALKSLYRLCDNMETPLADIVTVSDTIGHKAGRLKIMDYVKRSLEDNTDIDLDTLGMVADEPDAYPQMMSDAAGGPDIDWINNIAGLLSHIPDKLDTNDVLDTVDKYCENQLGKEEISKNPSTAVVLSVIERLTKIDTPTGIATGIWGDDSTTKKETIKSLFNLLASEPGDTWEQRAASLRYDMAVQYESGKKNLSIGNVSTSKIAKKNIAHLRMNPYYATKAYSTDSDDYKLMIQAITNSGIINKFGSRIKLAIPGCVFDSNTFNYIVMMAINMANNSRYRFTRDEAFLNALMCYKSGVRMTAYIELMDSVYEYLSKDDPEIRKAINDAEYMIQKFYHAKAFNNVGMVKDDNGLFTYYAYLVLCTYARLHASTPDEVIDKFDEGLGLITSAGNTGYDLKPMMKNSTVSDDENDDENPTSDDTSRVPVTSSEEPVTEETPSVTDNASYTMEDDDGTELNVYASGDRGVSPKVSESPSDIDPELLAQFTTMSEDYTPIKISKANKNKEKKKDTDKADTKPESDDDMYEVY